MTNLEGQISDKINSNEHISKNIEKLTNSEIPKERKEKILNDFATSILLETAINIAKATPEEDRENIVKALNDSNDELFIEIVNKHNINLEEIINSTIISTSSYIFK